MKTIGYFILQLNLSIGEETNIWHLINVTWIPTLIVLKEM